MFVRSGVAGRKHSFSSEMRGGDWLDNQCEGGGENRISMYNQHLDYRGRWFPAISEYSFGLSLFFFFKHQSLLDDISGYFS